MLVWGKHAPCHIIPCSLRPHFWGNFKAHCSFWQIAGWYEGRWGLKCKHLGRQSRMRPTVGGRRANAFSAFQAWRDCFGFCLWSSVTTITHKRTTWRERVCTCSWSIGEIYQGQCQEKHFLTRKCKAKTRRRRMLHDLEVPWLHHRQHQFLLSSSTGLNSYAEIHNIFSRSFQSLPLIDCSCWAFT